MFFNRIPAVSIKQLEQKLVESPTIIDVRTPQEFVSGHIPGAKNVSLNKIGSFQPKGFVYVICQTGGRSRRATKELTDKGYEAMNVKGGMVRWKGKIRGGKL